MKKTAAKPILKTLIEIIIKKNIFKLLNQFNFSKTNKQVNLSNQKKATSMTLTILLITLNQLTFFTIPDLIIIISQKENTIFYLMNLNKGNYF